MKRIYRCALALAMATAPCAQSVRAEPGPGTSFDLVVTDLHSAKGQLIVCLWRDKAGFPGCEKSRTALRRVIPVTATAMHIAFPLPAPGRYAVTVVHDEDGDGKTRHNFIGMPLEGVGISNTPGGMPGYDKSLAPLAPGANLTVRMKYLFGG